MLVLLLQLVFIALRLDSVVDWPWLVVLSPTFVTLVGFLVFGPPFSYHFYEIDEDEEESE